MLDNLLPLLSFVFITTFTPGPNNISSASMGLLHGYKNTLRYLAGITVGFFFMMLLSASISSSLLNLIPAFQPILRLVGAAYILYLAYSVLKANYSFQAGDIKPLGFVKGLMLQLLNPKVIVYGLTLFSAFLVSITQSPLALLLAALFLAATAFGATSTWALFGATIKSYLHHPRVKIAVNTILSLLLIYTALELTGIF